MSEERTAYYRPVAIRPATLLIIDKRNIPYIVSLVVLAFTSKKSRAPKAEGIPYDPGTR